MKLNCRDFLAAFTLLAWLGISGQAAADPIPQCTSAPAPASQYAGCQFDGKVFANFSASSGGYDVSSTTMIRSLLNEFPTEPYLLPLLAAPVPGGDAILLPSQPYSVSFSVSTLGPTLNEAYIQIRDFHGAGFSGTVTATLVYPWSFESVAHPFAFSAGAGPNGMGLPSFVRVGLVPSPHMRVRLDIDGMAAREGASVGFYVLTAADPVPEPATLLLVGAGVTAVAARARRDRKRAGTSKA